MKADQPDSFQRSPPTQRGVGVPLKLGRRTQAGKLKENHSARETKGKRLKNEQLEIPGKLRTAGDERTNGPPAGNARLDPRDAYITTVLILKREPMTRLGPSTTGVDRLLDQAAFAGDLAAPPEPALAVDFLLDDPGVVSPAAAEQLAAVHTLAGGVAATPLSAQGPRLPVQLAEVGRVLAVDQIEPIRRLDGRPLGDEAVPVVARDHLRRAVERLLQPVPNVAERRHLPPTGANRARAGQPVTLALGPHEVAHRLNQTVKSSRKPCQIRGATFAGSTRGIENGNKVQVAYQTTSVVVVQLDQRLDVAAFSVRRVHELPRLFESEFHVVPAASPFPIALRWQALLEFGGGREFA